MFEVKVEKPRGIKDDPAALERWSRSAPVSIAQALAEAVRKRVQGEGKASKPHTPHDFEGKLVSPRYPGAEKGRLTSSGARAFKTALTMHQALGTRPGSFSPSGGMWAGESVVGNGRTVADVLFRGRSEGQDPNFFGYKSGAKKARGAKVSNALKAATVLKATGINVLELEDSEIESVARALVAQYAEDAVRLLGQGGQVDAPRDSTLVYRRIRELLGRG